MEATASISEQGITFEGSFGGVKVHFRAARVREALSRITEIRIEFVAAAGRLAAEALLGMRMRLTMNTDVGVPRRFQGTVTAIDYMGTAEGFDLYGVDVRPWLWFLTRCSDNRIFQGQSSVEVFDAVCRGRGFGGNYRTRLSGSCEARDYCVQYGETDFAFVSRLLEDEGIAYYFDHQGDGEEMVLADGIGSYDPVPGGTLKFVPRSRDTTIEGGDVFEWFAQARVVSGAFTLVDYDMTKPNADLKVTSAIARGRHGHASYERYEIDGYYAEVARGNDLARVRMEGEAHRALRYVGAANAPHLGAGRKFTLSGEPRLRNDASFLVIEAEHHLRATDLADRGGTMEALTVPSRLHFPDDAGRYVCRFVAAPAEEPFRPARVTPWPHLTGLHTAVVTGPPGEEIHTDDYGRIKVQFHWDREGKKDDRTTCWVRTVVPWSGRGWGMFAVPRVGQEVVIQFERGNPDRPICTGMLYNDAARHPVRLPDNRTMTGLRTNSSKGGKGFHELVFEDKKDAEFIRMVSERDYIQTVKRNATVSIGEGSKGEGDLIQTVHRHKTEILRTGDHTFTVEKGHQKVSIKQNRETKIGGKSDTTITGDTKVMVEQGNFAEVIAQGNRTREVKAGNDDTKVSMGDITIDAAMGKITITAMQEILLKVGASTVKLSQAGVDIKGMMVQVEGTAMLAVKAPICDIKGTGMLVLKGSLTMIN